MNNNNNHHMYNNNNNINNHYYYYNYNLYYHNNNNNHNTNTIILKIHTWQSLLIIRMIIIYWVDTQIPMNCNHLLFAHRHQRGPSSNLHRTVRVLPREVCRLVHAAEPY